MGYILKDEVAKMIRAKYKNSYFKEKLDLSDSYTSLILNQRVQLPKSTAYSFSKIFISSLYIQGILPKSYIIYIIITIWV